MTAGIEVTPKGGEGGFMEPTLDVVITGGAPLHATDINADEVPTLVDEIPILAVAAMFADGVSRFAGLSELRVKESDRLAKTCELVNLAGGKATVEGDALIIDGRTRGKRSLPFTFDPLKDHRLAMAAAVLAKVGGVGGQIKDSECVAVSFPDFFELLELF
jgi:3-phosphoshikimate 1-carboxyvinyltransferase